MRIDVNLGGAAIEAGRTGCNSAQRSGERGQNETFGVDEATLSSGESTLASLKLHMSQMPDNRAEKVEALRKQVANGSYQLVSSNVADALVRDIMEGAARG